MSPATVMILASAGVGAGVWLLVTALIPPRTDLAVAVGRWDAQRARPTHDPRNAGWQSWLGRKLVALAHARGISFDHLRADLEITGRTLDTHLATTTLTATAALLVPPVLTVFATVVGITLPITLSLGVGVLAAAAAVVSTTAQLKTDADTKRRELRHALGTFLDLVSMSLAGGRGIPEALPTAATIGTGWAFDLISDTITTARRTGHTPWEALGTLGKRTGLQELVDLSASLRLVGDNGAKVRASLGARATTLRRRQLADEAADAAKADDSMRIAQVILALGFFLLIGYPAAMNVLAT